MRSASAPKMCRPRIRFVPASARILVSPRVSPLHRARLRAVNGSFAHVVVDSGSLELILGLAHRGDRGRRVDDLRPGAVVEAGMPAGPIGRF